MRTMIILVALSASTGITGSAAAESFTGFYAGVNAGYAFEGRDRASFSPGTITGERSDTATEAGLPPSAREASRAMRAPTTPLSTKAPPVR